MSAVVGADCASGSNFTKKKKQQQTSSGCNTPVPDLHGSVGEMTADGINDKRKRKDIDLLTKCKRKKKEHDILTKCNTLVPDFDSSDGKITWGDINKTRGKKQRGSLSKCNSLVQCEIADDDMNNTKNKRQDGASICNLLVDILIEILSRLPASSILRFRYVCKLWFTLITTDPTLPKLHLNRGFKVADCASILTVSLWGKMRRLTIMGADGQRKHTVLEMEKADIGFSLSCNGLLCLFGRHNRSLWLFNPSTQQMLRLPGTQQMLRLPGTQQMLRLPGVPQMHRLPKSFTRHATYCYLAYLPRIEQYKVLRFVKRHKSGEVTCEVLTVGTLLWRQIMPPSFGTPSWYGVVISGSMYCKMWSSERNISGSQIMSFDFDTEKFDKIHFPKFLAGKDNLFEFEGHLCVAIPNGVNQ